MAGVDSYGHIVSYIDRMPGTLASLTCRRKYRMKFLTFSGTNVPICEDILGSAFFKLPDEARTSPAAGERVT